LRSFRAKVAAVAALVLVLTPTAGLSQQSAGKLSITVSGARNSDGVVRCALFNSPAAFPKIGQEWRGVIAPDPRRRGELRVHRRSARNLRHGILSRRA
jgi:hypothetical protein